VETDGLMFETDDERAERHRKAIEFAAPYVRSFDRNLLEHWYRQVVERTLPPTATHAELAADNALRAFVVGIIRQYQFAVTGNMETPWLTIPQPPPPQQQPPSPKRRKRSLTP
jgi:hypothetical protein